MSAWWQGPMVAFDLETTGPEASAWDLPVGAA